MSPSRITIMADGRRTVVDGLLVSTDGPPLRAEIDPRLEYLGATELVIKGVALAERHHWVEARGGAVQRLLVMQFEGWLPSNEEHYDYPLPDPVEIGGETYGRWTFGYRVSESSSPETADTVRFLAERGLALADEQLMARYARIVGDDRRRELLVFHHEPVARLGHSLASLTDGGALRPEYASVGTELHARARRAFRILPPR
jgi:hypothetical protein